MRNITLRLLGRLLLPLTLLLLLPGCPDWLTGPHEVTPNPWRPDVIDGDTARWHDVPQNKEPQSKEPQSDVPPGWDAGQPATPGTTTGQPNRFPPTHASLMIGNATAQVRVVRMRRLRASVKLNCDAIATAPELALRPQHFEPAKSWLVASMRAVPVLVASKNACSAVLIDGTGLPPRLLFWKNGTYKARSLATTVQGAQNSDRLIRIQAVEGKATWSKHPARFGNLSRFDPGAPAACKLPGQEQDLSWTALPAGNHTIIEVLTAPDGCSAVDLLTDLGNKRVYICMPPKMMPFKSGDDLYIAALATGHNVLPLTGVELLSDPGHVRMGRGTDVVYFGKGDAKISVTKGCPALHDDTGTYARALSITIQEPGKPAFQLDNGATVQLASGGTLHLVRAVERLVWDLALTPKLTGARHIESVWSKQ